MAEKLKFHSWIQSGLTQYSSSTADEFGRPSNTSHNLNLGLKLNGHDDIRFDFSIQGPGDVASINIGQILKVEPKNGTPDFEPNYFPFVEFLSPEFPWLFSPTKQGAQDRIRPWIALIAVKADADFSLQNSGSGGNQILSIHSGANNYLPDLEEYYAWAHVQESLPSSREPADLTEYISENETKFISRLICPANLDRNTPYKMFLVPCFEAGRLSGLGQEVGDVGFVDAWNSQTNAIDLPIYYQWSFTTGNADIEELMRRLKPYPVDETVGLHDLDISKPRGGLNAEKLDINPNELNPISFTGALVSPIAKPNKWPKKHKEPFQKILSKNLTKKAEKPKDSQKYDPLKHDPVVTPPKYGSWQSDLAISSNEVDKKKGEWISELNLDPSHRSVAGLGSKVIRKHQEDYMAQAWEYARNVSNVQKELRKTRMALAVSQSVHKKVASLNDANLLQLSSPMHRLVKDRQKKEFIFKQIENSDLVPSGLSDSQFRRSAVKQQKRFKVKKSGNDAAKQKPIVRSITQSCIRATTKVKELAVYKPSSHISFKEEHSLQEITFTQPSQASSTEFTRRPGIRFRPGGRRGQDISKINKMTKLKTGKTFQLQKGKIAALDNNKFLMPLEKAPLAYGKALEKQTVTNDINLKKIASDIRVTTNPNSVLSTNIFKMITGLQKPSPNSVKVPKFANIDLEFDEPTYVKMQELEPEFFMPGFGSIPNNSVSVVEVNPKFIESYLAGLNNEMSRELAWREFPALLNQTWFKLFWNYIDNPNQKDIENISKWEAHTKLGQHAYGFKPQDQQSRLVLLIKGDLLRQYPNLSIYAAKANWKLKSEIADAEWFPFDPMNLENKENKWTRHVDLKDSHNIKLPIFKGHIGKDAHFLGFDLDVDKVVGSTNKNKKDPGWFFVFEEQIDEPRFGLDIPDSKTKWGRLPSNIEDLSWGHLVQNEEELQQLPHVPLKKPWLKNKKIENTPWGKNSAQMAKLTYQNPVRMMFHGDSLVKSDKEDK